MNHKLVEMLLNGLEIEKLYTKLIPVSIEDAFTTRETHLIINMEWQKTPFGIGMYDTKILSLSLTDEEDIFFLYNLQITEEDFPKLKAKQNIKGDLFSFPQMLINYFEKCLLEEPSYILVFTRTNDNPVEYELSLVENKDLVKVKCIYLNFIPATEPDVTQHVKSTFKCLKEERKQLKKHLACLEQDLKRKLADCHHALNLKVQELESVRTSLNADLKMKDSEHQSELQQERNKLLSMHKDEINKLENEIKDKERNFCKEIKQLESNFHFLDTLKKELEDKNSKNESTIGELNSKVLFLEDELKHLKENLQSYKHKCEKLQSDVREKVSRARHQDEIINESKQELRSKEQSILKLKDWLDSEIELKNSLEKQLKDIKLHLDMSEKQRQALQSETEQLNKVIIDLQDKIQEISNQEKTKNHDVAKYKRTVEEKEKTLLNIKHKISQLNIALEKKEVEVKSLTDSNYALQKKLEETQQEAKDKDNVVKWLNKQMSEHCIVPQYVAPSNLATSPSAVAQKQLVKISSQSPENSPSTILGKNIKSVRMEEPSPVREGNSSTPSRFHKTPDTDSAYCTASLHSNKVNSEVLAGSHNVNFDPNNFGPGVPFHDGDHKFKHSTAKKPAKPVKSNTPKYSKKR